VISLALARTDHETNESCSHRCPARHDSSAMPVDSLPISDVDFLAEFINALRNESSVFDMPDTAPLKHWQNDTMPETLDKIARQFLVCILVCC
jgi:hypothetical protein